MTWNSYKRKDGKFSWTKYRKVQIRKMRKTLAKGKYDER